MKWRHTMFEAYNDFGIPEMWGSALDFHDPMHPCSSFQYNTPRASAVSPLYVTYRCLWVLVCQVESYECEDSFYGSRGVRRRSKYLKQEPLADVFSVSRAMIKRALLLTGTISYCSVAYMPSNGISEVCCFVQKCCSSGIRGNSPTESKFNRQFSIVVGIARNHSGFTDRAPD